MSAVPEVVVPAAMDASSPFTSVPGTSSIPPPFPSCSKETTARVGDSNEPSLNEIFDLAPVASAVLSPSFQIRRASPSLRHAWGLRADSCIGHDILLAIQDHIFLSSDDRDCITHALQTAKDKRTIQTLSGQGALRNTPALSDVDQIWSIRIVPVFRTNSLLALIFEWAQSPAHALSTNRPSTPTALRLSEEQTTSTADAPEIEENQISDESAVVSHQSNSYQIPLSGLSSDESFRILIQIVKDYAIFLLDVDGKIATWNAGAELNKGYTQDEVIGKHFSIFYAPEDIASQKPQRELEICLREGRVEDEGWRIRKDGSRFWANVTITAIYKNGVHVGFGKVTRNMTERRAAELRVIAAYEESAKLKSDFLANMSHEIRTPMHGMLSACGLLLDTPLTPDQREIASIIDESGQVLLRVINDILDYSKLASGNFSIHTDIVGIASIITSVARSVQSTLQPNVCLRLELASDLPRAVQGDPLRYRQILLNIVGNATKFTDKGQIHIESAIKSQDDDTFVILTKVTDTGIGIPQDAVTSLFIPFKQVDDTTKKRFQGTGLGLSICKSLVELMGGEIGFQPNPEGQGSVFWFTTRFLKIKSLAQLKKPSTESTPERLQRRRTMSPTGQLFSPSELDRPETVPPSLGRIAKTTGLSKAEVASGAGFDLAEYNLSFLTPPEEPEPIFTSETTSSISAPATGLSPSTHVNPADVVVPSPSAAGKPANMSASLSGPNLPNTDETLSTQFTLLSTQAPVTSPIKRYSSSNMDYDMDDHQKELQMDFERSLALLRARSPSKRVLIAEDNSTNQRVLLRMLKDLGFDQERIVVASDGAQAIARAREQPTGFDLCLMDISMPVVDGHEATVQIRKSGINFPILAMTAHALQGDREQCFSYGMNDYIAKPVNKRLLVERLLAWLPK